MNNSNFNQIKSFYALLDNEAGIRISNVLNALILIYRHKWMNKIILIYEAWKVADQNKSFKCYQQQNAGVRCMLKFFYDCFISLENFYSKWFSLFLGSQMQMEKPAFISNFCFVAECRFVQGSSDVKVWYLLNIDYFFL